jgi:hypothetical protein
MTFENFACQAAQNTSLAASRDVFTSVSASNVVGMGGR